MQVLNFYSTVFADQLKRGRKTATIRLGDKSHKYQQEPGACWSRSATSTRRARRSSRRSSTRSRSSACEELSPRDIEHDNPEFRRHEEMIHFLEQIYGRAVDDGGHRHRRALLADHRAPAAIRERLQGIGGAQN